MAYLQPRLEFLGATGTVTGSRTAVICGTDIDDRVLVDAGLYQGLKELRLRNWTPLPVPPESFGAVLITHAHIDHCGYLPRLVQSGFRGPIYCSTGTADLLHIMLLDAAHLQEEEARFANKTGYSKHSPALPLYTTKDAEATLRLLRPVPVHHPFTIGKHLEIKFLRAGHILGSNMIHFQFNHSEAPGPLLFSGDIGRFGQPILPDPEVAPDAETVVMESTYGGRLHQSHDPETELADVITRSIERGGVLIIPAFAVGRTQHILYLLNELQVSGKIPVIPIYLDSPMAIRAMKTYGMHEECLDAETQFLNRSGAQPLKPSHFQMCQSARESKELNNIKENAIIISASGMVTGGRILHHMKQRLPDAKNTVLFIGYQGIGTRGRSILEGKKEVKIHGSYVEVNCHIESIDGFSAHADHDELLTWLKKFPSIPRRILINHGEPEGSTALAAGIEKLYGIKALIPEFRETITLSS